VANQKFEDFGLLGFSKAHKEGLSMKMKLEVDAMEVNATRCQAGHFLASLSARYPVAN
jgi:hypothetical protein